MAKNYKSDILRSVHLAASDLADVGVVDETTMREFDRQCLTKPTELSARNIRNCMSGLPLRVRRK
jgi:DNA-binding transcriptional regulator YiaG